MTVAVATAAVIREAVPADVLAIVTMGQRFLAEPPYKDLIAVNPEAMVALIEKLMAGAATAVLVAEQDGDLVGMVGLVAYHHHVSGEWVAGEVFFWIQPAARGSTGVRLLKAAERWARAIGAATFQMGAPACSPRVAALYQRLGYVEIETAYQRRLTS